MIEVLKVEKIREKIFVYKKHSDMTEPCGIPYRDVRGAVVWPTPSSPGYFCILGEENWKGASGKYPLHFFAEGQADLPGDLFRLLTDEGKRMCCETFYTDQREGALEYVQSFNKYLSENKLGGISLVAAPFIENFQFGVTLIRQWRRDGALEIPENTTVYEQLRQMRAEDLEGSPEVKFYAVNGLRFVVGGFEKFESSSKMTREELWNLYNEYHPRSLDDLGMGWEW